ncbi:hypothetical protein DCCM_3427 [Desulfocucumis palustris]|uniref:Uncharacterized protein n=1 Tax=Desulfocucumis palustris TaxID=1898651 RepID=A0A2L2XDM2_9FIRM|nr:hypothetical protein DCCM_3427 [Desulfocucumis palustris]
MEEDLFPGPHQGRVTGCGVAGGLEEVSVSFIDSPQAGSLRNRLYISIYMP